MLLDVLTQDRSHSLGSAADPCRDNTTCAFGWLPDEWARGQSSPECLCILAYRCTFADGKNAFGLWESHLSARQILVGGFGENVRSRAIAEAVSAGWLDRPHNSKLPRGPGYTFRRSVDRLILPEDPTRRSQKVQRSWFSGILSCSEMATLLFLRAGTGKGRGVYARELIERFDWSEPTALKALRGLRRRGIVELDRRRDQNGRVNGVVYLVRNDLGPQLAASPPQEKTTHKKPGDGLPPDGLPTDGKPADIRRTPLDGLKTPERKENTSRGEGPCFGYEVEGVQDHAWRAWQSSKILGWIGDVTLREDWDDVDPEFLELIEKLHSGQDLANLVKEATAGRVHDEILSPAGCYGVRYLAAFILAKDDHESPEGALDRVLQAMQDRIGSRPDEWLNSLALLGQRFDGDAGQGEDFYVSARRARSHPFEDLEQQALYEKFVEADAIVHNMLGYELSWCAKKLLMQWVHSQGAGFDPRSPTDEDFAKIRAWILATEDARVG